LRATLDAYANGEISLGKISSNTPAKYILNAPSTLEGVGPQNKDEAPLPYTMLQLAKFLRWTKKAEDKTGGEKPSFAFQTAFRALHLIERGIA
jgi:hypothetical protein